MPENVTIKASHYDEIMRQLNAVRALAAQWNETPDFKPTPYDEGRVDQRHDMTMQLLEILQCHEH